MKRHIIPHSGGRVKEYTLAAAQTFKSGALVLMDANEDVATCGADPTSVLGVSASPAAAEPEPGRVLVNLGSEEALFWADGDNAPTKADINQQYGAAVDGDGIWHVDGTETTAKVFYVVDVDLDTNRYLVRILAAVRQSAP